ncbi:MAG: transposase [Fibrobacterota bacterium]
MHERKSPRLREYDYSAAGSYFLTLCAYNHYNIFGQIVNGTMIPNEFGAIAINEFMKSFEIRKELIPDEFVIMPNHLHALVHLMDAGRNEMPVATVENTRRPRSISSFVAGFKSSVTKQINLIRTETEIPIWQGRYYDHIIRHPRALDPIRNYIRMNPAKWDKDQNRKKRLL